MLRRYIVLSLCFVLCLSSATAQEYLNLEYHFDKGDQYQIHSTSNQETYLTVNEVDQRTTNNQNMTMLLTFKGITPDGGAKIQTEYKKIILSSSQKDTKVSVNTDSNESDIFNKLFKALINKKFTIVLSPTGEVEKVSGMDAIIDQMIDTLPDVKKKERPKLKNFLTEHIGPEQVKLNLSLVIPQYPPFKVHKGDAWSNHVKTKGLYDGTIDNYWSLKYGNKFMAKLENNAKFSSNLSKVLDLGGGQKGRVNLHGDIKGEYVVNPKTSWPTRSIIHSELKGDFTFFVYKNKRKKKKGQKQELKVPVRIIRNMNFEIKHL